MLQNFLDFEQESAVVCQICVKLNAFKRWPLWFDTTELNLLPESIHWSYVTWHYCQKHFQIKSQKSVGKCIKGIPDHLKIQQRIHDKSIEISIRQTNSGFSSFILRNYYLLSKWSDICPSLNGQRIVFWINHTFSMTVTLLTPNLRLIIFTYDRINSYLAFQWNNIKK